jgi:dihydropteroate synthase
MLRCADRDLVLDRPRVMGILNVTPDSFSDGGRFYDRGPELSLIIDTARAMLEAGADILDVGGESTRPGAEPVPEDEECRRVMPVIERLHELGTIISVDTCKPGVARRAVRAGAHLVNDVTGMRNPEMVAAAAEGSAAICIMHMRGEPRTMQLDPRYDDVVAEIRDYLAERVAVCRAAGICRERMLLDPGFGFGKRLEHNLALLRRLEEVRVDDLPLLAGLSRKSMIGLITGRAVDERLGGSVAAALLAAQRGADILRVHDVAATVDALKVLEAMQAEGARLS